ncbi:MAG: alpha/beta hydrolase [Aquihabitans sp.]
MNDTHVFTASLGPVDLSIVEAGRGGRPLLLLHGFTGAKEDFGDWMQRFAHEGWWVVAPDLRGHGGSTKLGDEAQYSLAHMADDATALAEHLGWESYHLLGHSMGGMVAQELVLRPTSAVERLVLMDTHHGPITGLAPDVVASAVSTIRTEGLSFLLDFLDTIAPDRSPSEAQVYASRPGFEEWSRSKPRACDGAMYAAMAVVLTTRPDRLAELRAITVPTRVVVGAQDRDFIEASRRMAETIPGADVVVIADAAHSPQFENPDGWWQAVAPFLAG